MHELLLYGQVSAARHGQVMKILAGVAAMQPRRTLQRRVIYRPEREPEEPSSHVRRGGTQTVTAAKQKQQKGLEQDCDLGPTETFSGETQQAPNY